MSNDSPKTPPVSPGQWLDLVVGCQAHRSGNPGHQQFGQMLVQRYFTELPTRYQGDPVAMRYFDEMLCAVAAAIRGFSFVRDVFQTNWDSIKADKERALRRADQLEAYSPLSRDGLWGKAIGALAGIGLGAPIVQLLKDQWSHAGLWPLLILAGCAAIGLVLLEVVVEWLRARHAKRSEEHYPNAVMARWEERSLNGYRAVLRQFLPLAREITERHYPGSCAAEATEEYLDVEVERHLAFRPTGTTE